MISLRLVTDTLQRDVLIGQFNFETNFGYKKSSSQAV